MSFVSTFGYADSAESWSRSQTAKQHAVRVAETSKHTGPAATNGLRYSKLFVEPLFLKHRKRQTADLSQADPFHDYWVPGPLWYGMLIHDSVQLSKISSSSQIQLSIVCRTEGIA